jgi:hypothetical protein
MAGKTGQKGVSFITVIFIMAVLAGVGLMAAQAFPAVLEYQATLKAINKASKEGSTVPEVRQIFDRAAQVDNITTLKGRDLTITKEGDSVVVSFAYDKEYHMFGPAFLLLKFEGNSKPGR